MAYPISPQEADQCSFSRTRAAFRSGPLAVIALACAVTLALGGTAIADGIFDNSPPYAGQTRFYAVITAKHSELNLNVPEASTENGTQIIQWKQPGATNEQWELVGQGSRVNSQPLEPPVPHRRLLRAGRACPPATLRRKHQAALVVGLAARR